MESKQAKVRCPHCSVEFGFALPQKYVDRPSKNLKFMCEYCTEKFSVLVADLFSEDDTELASLKIRHQSTRGLMLYDSWEDIILSASTQEVGADDPISAFGESWKPASMSPELANIFPDIVDESEEESKPSVMTSLDERPEHVVEVEEEPSYEDDMFMETPSEDPSWDEVAPDPFDIPIIDDESFGVEKEESESDGELVDLIADGAMDLFLEESEEVVVAVEEDSEDPFLAISDEVEPQGEHSIDALLSTLESGVEDVHASLGTNTLELLNSEEVLESEEVVDAIEENSFEPSPIFDDISEEGVHTEEDSVEPPLFDDVSEETVMVVEDDSEDIDTMKTVIGDSGTFDFDESEEDINDTVLAEDGEDFFIATASIVSEEDSVESPIEENQTIIGEPDWKTEEDSSNKNEEEEVAQDLDFFSPGSWEEEELDESHNGSDSVDYDQTEEEESQSALNPAFQMSTKKVVRKQYWAVAMVAVTSLVAAILVSRYFSLSDVSSFFIPTDDIVAQDTAIKKRQKRKLTSTKVQASKVQKTDPVETKVEKTEKEGISIAKEKTEKIAKKEPKAEKKTSMMVVPPKKGVFLDDKPLSRRKAKKKTSQKKEIPKLPPMDPKRATREGWIKIEDKSYESAKAIFEDVIYHEPTPEALLGIGFAEERMADRYKERKDFIRVEAHHDQAHKYYCEAMEFYTREDTANDDLRFGIKYVQARLKVISRGCI